MKIRIQKWGNSLAVRIPKSFAQEIHMDHGTIVDLALEKDQIIIRPVIESQYSLNELLSKVTKENIHSKVDTGKAQGKEIW